jgi:hypothetical protein
MECLVGFEVLTPVVMKSTKSENKAIPVTDLGGPYVCETSRLLYFIDNGLTDGVEVVSLEPRPSFTPGRFLVLISVRG